MDQDATWYGGRSRPTRHCVRCGPSYPQRKGTPTTTQFLAHVYCCRTVVDLGPGRTVLDGVPAFAKGTQQPPFRPMSIVATVAHLSHCRVLVMVALWNRADHYIFALWFLRLSSFFFLSSPNLSRRRLDVCHTSTHGVSLVRIYDAGLKCAARCTRLPGNAGPKKVAKNRLLSTIAQLCRAISSQRRHVSTIGEKVIKQEYVLQMSPQYGELRPTSG